MFMEQGVFVEVGVERGGSRLVGKEKLQNSKKEQVILPCLEFYAQKGGRF